MAIPDDAIPNPRQLQAVDDPLRVAGDLPVRPGSSQVNPGRVKDILPDSEVRVDHIILGHKLDETAGGPGPRYLRSVMLSGVDRSWNLLGQVLLDPIPEH